MRRSILLAGALAACRLTVAMSADAQAVTYYENMRSADRPLEPDRMWCENVARAYAYEMIDALPPVSLPNTTLGRAIIGATQIAVNTRAQRYFDERFADCLRGFGWAPVSDAEVARRRADAERSAENAVRQQAEAERRAAESARAHADSVAAFMREPPHLLEPEFDAFEQDTLRATTLAALHAADPNMPILGAFYVRIPRDPSRPQLTGLLFVHAERDPWAGGEPRFVLLLNDSTPYSIPQDAMDVAYEAPDSTRLGTARIFVRLTPRGFQQLSTLDSVRARLGDLEFVIPPAHMAAMRQLAATLRAEAPPARNRERRKPTARTRPPSVSPAASKRPL